MHPGPWQITDSVRVVIGSDHPRGDHEGRLRRVDLGRGDAVLEYDGPGRSHFQVIERGCLVAWEIGSHPNPDAVITLDPRDVDTFFAGSAIGPEVVERTWITGLAYGGTKVRHRPVPLDEFDNEALAVLPEIPNADLAFDLTLSATPFGTIRVIEEFHNGVRARWAWGEGSSPAVSVAVPFVRYCEFRAGRVTALDALVEGQIAGEWSDIMLCDGLVEREEQLRVLRQECSPRAILAQGLLGALLTEAGGPG